MTEPVTDGFDQYVVVGGELTFLYTFEIGAQAELGVFRLRLGVITPLSVDVDYTVQGVGQAGGSTITPIAAESPVTIGDIWTIIRNTVVQSVADYTISGGFLALTTNDKIDNITRMLQDIKRNTDLSVKPDQALQYILNPLLPLPADRRTIVYEEGPAGTFALVTSNADPDTAAAEAIAAAAAALISEVNANASAMSVANQQALYATVLPLAASVLVYSGESFLFSGTQNVPRSMYWSNDGLRFYIGDLINARVYEYTVSVAYDLSSTVAASGDSLDAGPEINFMLGFTFNDDGTKVFVVDDMTRNIFEYTVSTAFDFSSTLAYSGESFDVSAQSLSPRGLAFSNDGLKFFLVSTSNSDIFEYTLSAAFDLSSTVAYSGNSLSINAQDGTPNDIKFNLDGTRFFIIGSITNAIYLYDLTTAFDLSTASYSGNSADISSEDTNGGGLAFNDDGLKLFIAGDATDTAYEYDLGVPFTFGASLTLDSTHNGYLVRVDSVSGVFTVTLPDSTTLTQDFRVGVVKDSGGANNVDVAVAGTDTVNGAMANIALATQYKIVDFVLDQDTGIYIASEV